MEIKKFDEFFLNESLYDEVSSKVTEKYKSLKRGILDLIDKTVQNSQDLTEVAKLMNDYIDETAEAVVLTEFVEDIEIYDFYLKFQDDIDEILEDKAYFDKSPKERNISSLYDYVIKGTKRAVKYGMEILKEEIF
jgi:hypothetical protein